MLVSLFIITTVGGVVAVFVGDGTLVVVVAGVGATTTVSSSAAGIVQRWRTLVVLWVLLLVIL
jgi:hypothetical protein